MKKKMDLEKELSDNTMKRFNKTGRVLAVCCVILLLIGCFFNGFMVIANCEKNSFELLISVFMSLIFTFMGSFGLGYYFSFKSLGYTINIKEKGEK